MVAGEANITVWRGFYPDRVERQGRLIRSVTFRAMSGDETRTVGATTFVDASYEGDLFALAGCAYRVGREARGEYDEPHAGRIFSSIVYNGGDNGRGFPRESVEGRLALRPFMAASLAVLPVSSGEGDRKVQSYHLRLCMTSNPANRVPVTRPADYDQWLPYLQRRYPAGCRVGGNQIPNEKHNWWQNLPAAAWDWADATWFTRKQIEERFRGFTLSLIYYLHHDDLLPEAARQDVRRWALAADEFIDNHHLPYELYVREARRLVGRYVLNEHDCLPAPGRTRPPVHADSIAFTEWFMDSHEMSDESID